MQIKNMTFTLKLNGITIFGITGPKYAIFFFLSEGLKIKNKP
jgi:hypothetical protein